jgi:site-specific DNA-methyltransferase (adenine-specific)
MIDLRLGDCLEVMKTIPDKSIDLVLTDPPYGINVQRVNCAAFRKDNRSRDKISWDIQSPDFSYIEHIFRIAKRHIIWGANHLNCFLDGGAIVWDKLQPLPDSSQCEIASISGYKKVFKYQQRWTNFVNTKQTEHPTEKPVGLMKYCIGLIKEANTILDPFMGSGTTGVACKELGRNFIGIEISPEYFKIAERRINQTSENLL